MHVTGTVPPPAPEPRETPAAPDHTTLADPADRKSVV